MGGQLLARVIDDGVSVTNVSYAHLNHLGSPVAFTDGMAAVVWPEQVGGTPYEVHAYESFGADFDDIGTPTEENKLRYTGKLFESEIGKHYFNARYLNAVTDTASPELPPRFLSPDAILGQPGNGQSWNRYASMANNPVMYVDPNGMDPVGYTVHTEGTNKVPNPPKREVDETNTLGWKENAKAAVMVMNVETVFESGDKISNYKPLRTAIIQDVTQHGRVLHKSRARAGQQENPSGNELYIEGSSRFAHDSPGWQALGQHMASFRGLSYSILFVVGEYDTTSNTICDQLGYYWYHLQLTKGGKIDRKKSVVTQISEQTFMKLMRKELIKQYGKADPKLLLSVD